ncbi:helix-turn-helix domain-containing protein [Kutzneria chonburiensis]|uniref:Helix-turn-helix domain-containing protein n=1 Tax=Kutzneria chonburiensis TaxID=1483604 RepID=A0ABV6MVJ0_9PSEU|nr:helix-turn-helix domain-containing protein [Kutzneria chonburiensis]
MTQGVGSREAARQVGINYRTAKRWQAAAKAAAAAVPAQPVTISSRYLSLDERILIADRVRQPGLSLRAIAAELNDRPRMTLGWDSPAERMTGLLTTTG